MAADPPVDDRSERCAIAIMAKAPRAGRTKTRLSPFLSSQEATDLACCFLEDMTANLALAARQVPVDPYLAFAPAGSEPAFASIVQEGTRFILADGSAPAPAGVEGLGRCLLQAAGSLLALGYGAVGLLNSDSPTLPTALLVQAVRSLQDGEDKVVLGASTDGGYYFVGMRVEHPNLFRTIDWSTEHVARQTRDRAGESGLRLVDLGAWYDVDDADSLFRLIEDLEGGVRGSDSAPRFPAPATAAWLWRHRIRQRLTKVGETGARSDRAASAAQSTGRTCTTP